MGQPLVSVVIPFYSEISWLKEALTSVQNQDYGNIEVLLINDGSNEDLTNINNIYDLNIKIIKKENGGPASARNLGIEKSNGKYIAFLDSDDIWLANKLSRQIKYMESEGYAWSQHSYEMFWDNSSKKKIVDTSIYSGNVFRECFISFKIQTSCVVVLRKILVEKDIRFPLEKRYGQDMDFYREIAKLYPLGSIKEVLSKFRIRGTNAGFRAKVQLNDKAATWKELKNERKTVNELPFLVILGYKISTFFSRSISIINRIFKKERDIEIISKILYIFPYVLFKISTKKV